MCVPGDEQVLGGEGAVQEGIMSPSLCHCRVLGEMSGSCKR